MPLFGEKGKASARLGIANFCYGASSCVFTNCLMQNFHREWEWGKKIPSLIELQERGSRM